MERILLTLHIDGVGEKRVNVRKNLPIQGLIDEIQGRFEQFTDGRYGLRLKGEQDPLDPERTLAQLSIKDDTDLEFFPRRKKRKPKALRMIQQASRQPLSIGEDEVVLQEERRGHLFEIRWQPAIIGRPYQMDPSKNHLLAVDLAGIPGSEYVSRHHAALTEEAGQITIEPLNKRNPTYVNDERISYGQQHVLQPGDRIRVGRIVLIFHLQS